MNTKYKNPLIRRLIRTAVALPRVGEQLHRRCKARELSTWVVVVYLIALATILRLFMLTNQSLWLDEGSSLAMTGSGNLKDTFHELWSITGGDKYQITYFFLLTLWRSITGDSQFTLQLLSAIPGLITPVLIYFSVRRLFNHSHAISSALFLACSAYCVSYSQEIRPYSFLLCLSALQLLVMVPALTSQPLTRGNKALFALVMFISCISSIFLMLFAYSLAIAHLLAYRDVKNWLRWWIPAFFASIPALLYYASTPAATDMAIDAINHSDTPLWQNILFSLYSHLAGLSYGPPVNDLRVTNSVTALMLEHLLSLSLLVVICTVLGVAALRSVFNHQAKSREYCTKLFFLLLFAIAFIAAALFATVSSINWMPRHSFYLMVPLSVLLPMGVMYRRGIAEKSISIAGLAFVGLFAVNLYSSYNYFYKSEHWHDDYRGAAAYLNTHVGEQDTSLMLWGEPYLLSYYGHLEVKSLWRLEDPVQIAGKIEEFSDTNDRLFVSINRYTSWAQHSQTLRTMLEATYDIELIAQFINFDIYKFERKDPLLGKSSLRSVATDDTKQGISL